MIFHRRSRGASRRDRALAQIAWCLLFGAIAPFAHARILRVNSTSAGAADGASWDSAFGDVQLALAAARPGDEIWIAAGAYKPTSGSDRSIAFVLPENVAIYGGFAGAETNRSQRDWTSNLTILSGDIGVQGLVDDNAYHIVVGGANAVLDGFTITDGAATGLLPNGDPARYLGGGMYNQGVTLTVANCTFTKNTANWNAFGGGGAMANVGAAPRVSNCIFKDNTTGGEGGGGMFSNNGSFPIITGCTFSRNSASAGSGAGMLVRSSSARVIDCVFSDNTSLYGGSGLRSLDSATTVSGSLFIANSANGQNCRGSGMRIDRGSISTTNCTFAGNYATGLPGAAGGPGVVSESADPCCFSGCVFADNHCPDPYSGGGGLTILFSPAPVVVNCLFSGNSAWYGGGLLIPDTSLATIINCTFTKNTAAVGGGADIPSAGPLLANCIFWANSAPVGPQLLTAAAGTTVLVSCAIQSSRPHGIWDAALGVDMGGNIDADPRFFNPAVPAGPDGVWRTADDGLRLQDISPCVDAADAEKSPAFDLLGAPRNLRPDIGAYENLPLLAARHWSAYR